MIIGKKSLEKRINSVGYHTIILYNDIYSRCPFINSNDYNAILEAGYKALKHRRKRILKIVDRHKQFFIPNHYVTNVETYIGRMMAKKAYEVMYNPKPPAYKHGFFTRMFFKNCKL